MLTGCFSRLSSFVQKRIVVNLLLSENLSIQQCCPGTACPSLPAPGILHTMPKPLLYRSKAPVPVLCLLATTFLATTRPAWALPVVEPATVSAAAAELALLEAFADPAELWGDRVGAVMERAYRECFKTYIIDGQVMTLRMPFAQNNERAELAGSDLEIIGGGKADPALLWDQIDGIVDSPDFKAFVALLGDGRDKVVIYDLPSQQWSVSTDIFDIARMKAGAYRGLPYKPYVLSTGAGARATDIYDYLYCIGRIGMDCSGFVWHILETTARFGGLDLGKALRPALKVPKGADPSLYVGTRFFDSRSAELIQVKDQARNLQPGDVILFRGSDGVAVHSAVIQSVDLASGVIRYLQSTDEAPPAERGVHDSYIYFDPASPELSLKDPAMVWSQGRFPPFSGERASAFSGDGERYRAYPEFGGGKVVRLKALAAPIKRIKAASGK